MAINENLRRNFLKPSGSSFVSSGRRQPGMTMQALAIRAAERFSRFARNGEIYY